jgi:transketolase
MSTGALGQGLSAGIGMALGARLRKKDFRVYVALGDGELNEGQVWEAAMMASKYTLDNLVAVVDYNQLALSDRVPEVMPLEPLEDKWAAFGWHVLHVNGHSVRELVDAFSVARQIQGKPTVILADTIKGYGISFLENKWNSHATKLTPDEARQALRELGCSEQEIIESLA